MTHTLSLTLGASTIALSSGSCTLMEYIPQSPDMTTQDTNSILSDGGERTFVSYRNVTESARVLVRSTAASKITALKHQMTQWFVRAQEKNIRRTNASPVFVNLTPSGTASSYRSEILSGRVDLFADSLDWRWEKNTVEMLLSWTRRYYWEGSEQYAKISNPSGSTSSSTRLPVIFWSGSTGNYAVVAGSSIAGEIPTPAFVSYFNNSTSVAYLRTLYISQGLSNIISPSNMIFESESIFGGYSGGFGLSSSSVREPVIANNSGCVIKIPVPASVLHSGFFGGLTQVLGPNILDGDSYALIMHTPTASNYGTSCASVFMQVKLESGPWGIGDLRYIYEGIDVPFQAGRLLQDLGMVRLPPRLGTARDYSTVGVDVYFRSAASVSNTLILDCIYVLPTVGFRRIDVAGGYLPELPNNTLAVTLDEYTETAFQYSPEEENIFAFLPLRGGRPVYLHPGQDQTLFFVTEHWSGPTSGCSASNSQIKGSVTVEYRPRRLTV